MPSTQPALCLGGPVSDGLRTSEVVSIDDSETIRAAGGDLLKAACGVHRTATSVHTDWLQLVWCYEAPEQQKVWDAMRPPSKKALELSDDTSLVDAALARYADRMAELEIERKSLVTDIVTLNGELAEMRANDENNHWYNNVADWARKEDVDLLAAEDRLNERMASLRSRKELAEIDFGNDIGAIWGAPRYQLADRGDVRSPYKYGASEDAYLNAVGTTDAPWSGPSMRINGDWTTKVLQLDQGANENIVDGFTYVADIAGLTSTGRTEFVRSGLKQFGNDAWTLTEPFITRDAPDEGYADSARRMVAAGQDAVGYGTWTTDGWNTAGTFLPGIGVTLASRGAAAPPLFALHGSMAAGHLKIPPGMRLHPALVIPAIQLRTSQAFATSKVRLSAAIDTSLSQLDGAFSAPALASPVAPSRAPVDQTPPPSLTKVNNANGTDDSIGRKGSPGPPATTGPSSPRLPPSDSNVPELTWKADYDQKKLEADHEAVIVGATLTLVEKAVATEPRVTADFLNALPEGARPHGLEHRIKSPESIATKIERKSETVPLSVTAGKMADIVRYTSVVPSNADLIPSAELIVENLRTEGWQITHAQHSYVSNSPYKGIHCTMRSEELRISVELQFRTENSQAIKDGTHDLYEYARDPSNPATEKQHADAQLRKISDSIAHPGDLATFHTLGSVNVERIVYAANRK